MSGEPIFGRASELELARAFVDRLGAGPVLLVEGEAGIGKTRLLEEAAAMAGAAGARICAGAARELESDRPFGVWVEALELVSTAADHERASLGRLIAGGSGEVPRLGEGPDVRFTILEGILGAIESDSVDGPIVLALDDLQWADPSTLMTLAAIARRLTHLPVAVLATMRPVPRLPALDSVIGSLMARDGRHVVLGPLEPHAIADMIGDRLGAVPGPNLLEQLEKTGGNPLFAEELTRALVDEGKVEVSDGLADLVERSLPPTMRLTILRRMSGLSKPTLELLRVASVLGSSFTPAELAAVTARTTVAMLGELDEAVQGGMLHETGGGLAFRHDLVREAVYEDLPQALRTSLHLDIGRALAATGGPAHKVGRHLSLGASPGDVDAAEWLHKAAREVGPRAPGVAADLLRRALEIRGDGGAEADELTAELVMMLVWSGELTEAERTARRALERDFDSRHAPLLHRGLARCLLLRGRLHRSLGQLDEASRLPGLSELDAARLVAEAAVIRFVTADLEGGEAGARRAIEVGERLEDEITLRTGLCALSWVAYGRGQLSAAVEHAERAVEIAARSTDPERCEPYIFLAAVLRAADRMAEAERVAQTGRRLAEDAGRMAWVAIFHVLLAEQRFLTGRFDDATAEAETGLDYAHEGLGATLGVVWFHALLCLIAVHRGDLDGARSAAASAEHDLQTTRTQIGIDWMLWGKSLLVEIDDPAAAFTILENTWDAYIGIGVAQFCPMGADLVRLALAAGATQRAHTVADTMEEWARRTPSASIRGAALHARGLVQGDPQTLLEAVSTYDRHARAFEWAAACEDAALAVSSTDRARATQLLDGALDVYDTAGAVRDIARVNSVLRSLGVRRGTRGGRQRPSTGWDSLTKSEREVVRHLVAGLTNPKIGERLFISRRTVETHLKHVYAKLGLTSRVELAADAARRGA